MRILFLSAEVEPFAKVGGLADVAGSLPKSLVAMGHECPVVMPAYGMVVNDPRWGAKKVLSAFTVTVNPTTTVNADLYEITHDGLTVWLIDGSDFFCNVSKSEELYTPGRDAYLFFAQAALEACRCLDWIPDVIHANDWHTAFVPVFLREKTTWEEVASVYTIHNLAYQGEFGPDTIDAAGLEWSTYNWNQLETWGTVNFLKSGCVFADQVNTVSPTYAYEIQTPEFGCRLQGLMSHLSEQGRLRGILNGIDTAVHDPATDPRIPAHFGAADFSGKAICRQALAEELRLDVAGGRPIVSVISRLSEQKGFDLIEQALESILEMDTVFAMLAIGDKTLAGRFRQIEADNPGRFRFVEAYDADLAQRVYAGSDIFLMPSSFEPCGLGQMFALRYGTIPVVRKTGGLADTVFEGKNGFVLENRSSSELIAATERAVSCYREPERWADLIKSAMGGSYGWDKSAVEYEKMYKTAISSRQETLVSKTGS